MTALGWIVLAIGLQVSASPEAPPPPAQAPPTPSTPTPVDEVVVFAPKPREPDWSKKLDLDPRHDYSKTYEPYLRQRQTNGCKMMAGGAKDPMGKSGAAGGMVCAKQF